MSLVGIQPFSTSIRMSLPRACVALIVIPFLFYLPSHSFICSPPHVVIGLLSMLLAATAAMRGIPRTLRAPQTPFRNSRFLWRTRAD
ncbi:hypothetical protein C8R44DRAFT_759466 [Mycena epipterygia]|nr:hypothetical protein C8R44DRAFT_759466 [Mycena epipterygia]